MNKLPGVGLIERAKALAPLIAGEADAIERTRRLTPPVVSALIDNGMYRALLPASVGGAEAPPEIFMQMLEEVAKVDASTAWCLGQCSVCAMTAAYLDADVAREIFGAPDGILLQRLQVLRLHCFLGELAEGVLFRWIKCLQ